MSISKFTIVIDGYGNEAFEEPVRETVRILECAIDKISMLGLNDFPLFDINGNKVGRIKVSYE